MIRQTNVLEIRMLRETEKCMTNFCTRRNVAHPKEKLDLGTFPLAKKNKNIGKFPTRKNTHEFYIIFTHLYPLPNPFDLSPFILHLRLKPCKSTRFEDVEPSFFCWWPLPAQGAWSVRGREASPNPTGRRIQSPNLRDVQQSPGIPKYYWAN